MDIHTFLSEILTREILVKIEGAKDAATLDYIETQVTEEKAYLMNKLEQAEMLLTAIIKKRNGVN